MLFSLWLLSSVGVTTASKLAQTIHQLSLGGFLPVVTWTQTHSIELPRSTSEVLIVCMCVYVGVCLCVHIQVVSCFVSFLFSMSNPCPAASFIYL